MAARSKTSRTTLLIKKASQTGDPLDSIQDKKEHVSQSGEFFNLKFFVSSTLKDAGLAQWAFDLVKSSLLPLYEKVWGWSDDEKMKQLMSPASRFVVIFHKPATATAEGTAGTQSAEPAAASGQPAESSSESTGLQPAAYINYRFEADYGGLPSLYIYEVMVEPAYQRQGLGTLMMQLAEDIAWLNGMDKCILTEFKENKAAATFYRKLGYTLDKASPKDKGYEILSKKRPAGK